MSSLPPHNKDNIEEIKDLGTWDGSEMKNAHSGPTSLSTIQAERPHMCTSVFWLYVLDFTGSCSAQC